MHENLVASLAQHRVPHFNYHPVVELFLPVLFFGVIDHHLKQANKSTPLGWAGVGAAGYLIADAVTTHEGLVLDNLLSS